MGAWIEIFFAFRRVKNHFVAPLVGAWIEICRLYVFDMLLWSLLSWERGLKSSACSILSSVFSVAPLVGAWIEILESDNGNYGIVVAPLVGAWIEISGRKQYQRRNTVAPLVGAWIEIRLYF